MAKLTIRQRVGRQLLRLGATVARIDMESKKAPFLWPVQHQGGVTWQLIDFDSYVSQGFNRNSLIYSAIMYKIKAAAQVSLRAYTGDRVAPTEVERSHPMARLLRRPNSYQSFTDLHGSVIASLNIAGNAYIYVDRDPKTAEIKALYPMRPDHVFLIPGKNDIKGYMYRPDRGALQEGVPLLKTDVIHIKFPNPGDQYEGQGYGLSPISAIADIIDVDNNATTFIKNFFERGGVPIGLLKYQIPLQDTDVATIKARWRDIYGGVDNWSDIGVIDMNASYEKLGQDFEKIGMNTLDSRNESRMLGPFGVPAVLLQTKYGLDRSTYSNQIEARLAFWQDTMSYELTLQEHAYNIALIGEDDMELFLKWDVSTVPALRPDIAKMVTSAKVLFDMGVPSIMALKYVGISMPDIPTGNKSFVQMNLAAYDEDGEPLVVAQPDQGADGDKPSGSDDTVKDPEDQEDPEEVDDSEEEKFRQQRLLFKSASVMAIDAVQPMLKMQTEQQFNRELSSLLTLTNSFAESFIKKGELLKWNEFVPVIEDFFKGDTKSAWLEALSPLVDEIGNTAGFTWGPILTKGFTLRQFASDSAYSDLLSESVDAVTGNSMSSVVELIKTADDIAMTVGDFKAMLIKKYSAWSNGESGHEEKADEKPQTRATLIAGNEATKFFNATSAMLFKEWGVAKKTWTTAGDRVVRDDHYAASGQTVDVDQPFTIGGHKMMFPGDKSMGAPLEQIINCRCFIVPGI